MVQDHLHVALDGTRVGAEVVGSLHQFIGMLVGDALREETRDLDIQTETFATRVTAQTRGHGDLDAVGIQFLASCDHLQTRCEAGCIAGREELFGVGVTLFAAQFLRHSEFEIQNVVRRGNMSVASALGGCNRRI